MKSHFSEKCFLLQRSLHRLLAGPKCDLMEYAFPDCANQQCVRVFKEVNWHSVVFGFVSTLIRVETLGIIPIPSSPAFQHCISRFRSRATLGHLAVLVELGLGMCYCRSLERNASTLPLHGMYSSFLHFHEYDALSKQYQIDTFDTWTEFERVGERADERMAQCVFYSMRGFHTWPWMRALVRGKVIHVRRRIVVTDKVMTSGKFTSSLLSKGARSEFKLRDDSIHPQMHQ